MDLVTAAYRAASALAQAAPGGVVDLAAPQLAALASLRPGDRSTMVARHQRRVTPGLEGAALRRRVRGVYRSYGRYYGESFRLPSVAPTELDDRMTYEGFDHVERARKAGHGPMLCLPHLGSWEWTAYWLTRVRGIPVTAVVERIEPPALFDWFVDFRERTTLPSGPAVMALRTGAPLLPTAVYDRGRGHHGVVLPPVPVERRGTFREDVVRVTQALAENLEELIRRSPMQWHLM